MTAANFPVCQPRLLRHEGGYSNHPRDPGGVTLEGVTQAVYDGWRRKKGLPRKTLTREMRGTADWIKERDAIYQENYWNPERCDELNSGVEDAIYDYAVNSGIGRSGKVLRRLIGLPDNTSVVTPEVVSAANRRDPKLLIGAIFDERLRFLRQLKTWDAFGPGWSRRCAETRSFDLKLAAAPAVAPPSPESVEEPSAKGEVPAPKAAKDAVKVGLPTAGGAGGVTWQEWVAAHPIESALIALGIVVLIGAAIYALNAWHKRKQEAPTPGTAVVPEMPAT